MEQITDINQIKNAVLYKVAEYAYEGTLEDKMDHIRSQILLCQASDAVFTEKEKY